MTPPTRRRPVLGLMHTAAVHVATFDALALELGAAGEPAVELRHVVRADLLARAQVAGPAAVADAVGEALAAMDVDAVLCTCSTIGGVADRLPGVLRVDRPMAAAAVALAAERRGPVVVLAALESTLAPTSDLIAEEADRVGARPEVRVQLVVGAWERFEAGDLDGYHALVAREAEEAVATGAAVVVLAQASMAPAAELVELDVPVLSSPRLGLRAAALLAHQTQRVVDGAGDVADREQGAAHDPVGVDQEGETA